ncbi:uncharacterized protein LOC143102849 [Alosa pseudoharengus]|uniref:uncharacterized protein LOC143102849 n=1 Tax=Alosa pseudoharengus TaxID=34774 RepID=UPI003F8B815E
MTRLDPPPHRPNPRAWMEESQSRDSFGQHSVGSRGDRDRESGYFSLGKAGGIRSSRAQSPPAPYRHSERGHPIPNTRSPEPKDTIPFRNPDLGVASHRRASELQNQDYLEECPLPEPTPLERSIEVEAQVGPRSPSPTPFKQAESFASNRRGFSGSNSRAKSPPAYSASQQQSRRGSSLSRSSSPARGTSSFKQSESLASLNSRSFGSSAFTQGLDQRSRSPSSRNSYGRGLDSGGAQKNFKSIASSVGSKSPSSSYADLRGSLRKAESTTSLASRGLPSRSSSPSRKGYDTPGQSMLRKSETNGVLSGHGHYTKSSSPSRRSYDTSSQSMLRKSDTRSSSNAYGFDRRNASPTRTSFDQKGQSFLQKTEKKSSSYGRDSPPTSRKGLDTTRPPIKHKNETASSLSRSSNAYGFDRRNASPTRTSFDQKGQSFLQKTEKISSSYGRDSPPTSIKGLDTTRPSIKHKNETASSLSRSSNAYGFDRRNASPTRTSFDQKGPGHYKTIYKTQKRDCKLPESQFIAF